MSILWGFALGGFALRQFLHERNIAVNTHVVLGGGSFFSFLSPPKAATHRHGSVALPTATITAISTTTTTVLTSLRCNGLRGCPFSGESCWKEKGTIFSSVKSGGDSFVDL
eukprot:RCo041657